uniref:60S acidic ribosomal protein P1 n=1 Tax=Pyramimonas obovata TaxID=1411642 RepID=A0A7S0R388_9CHLO|mmetsp:Transcript_24542/g.53586  ORF Transcript_24542/g.53586 Transcript_24542/m.53586 type:complete len:106 (+) Transcript_24542:91-408(+)|eukprot:CAMPEP_0118926524 /NCGR_PEP_ID=MMETSP1169-20130426/4183_1 /TAXON_ID=36882 /ORGANISM="Pyramimonas obovata, Strain CCMP722" /LENGTH=105 /DNA_ID=CAMNT_0006868091 /DNA_START=103 /DNA_END=420 /DNA_ORIENTATION=-
MSNSELACTYAALILADDEIAITADKISTIVKAAGVTVEPYWPGLFASLLAAKPIGDLVANVGAGGGGAAAAAGPAAAAGGAAAAAPEPEPEEEEEEDMGFDLFD